MSRFEDSVAEEAASVAAGGSQLAGATLREMFCSQELLLCFGRQISSMGSISKKATSTSTIKHPQNRSLTSQLTSTRILSHLNCLWCK